MQDRSAAARQRRACTALTLVRHFEELLLHARDCSASEEAECRTTC